MINRLGGAGDGDADAGAAAGASATRSAGGGGMGGKPGSKAFPPPPPPLGVELPTAGSVQEALADATHGLSRLRDDVTQVRVRPLLVC
jgi:hypothetical protein